MSSDPTRPNPEWWNSQDPQAPQRNQGYQAGQGYQANQGYQDSQPTQRLPVNQGYQASQDYAGPGPRIRRRRRRRWPWISLLAIIVILIAADRVGVVIAQNKMASQIQQQGFPTKPDVTIQGFPFLTQLAARDFKTVVISASNVTEGPLEIASLNATIHGMHINSSFSGATVDSINGSALITFAALAHAGGIPQGVMLSADGPNQIKATLNTPLGDLSVVAQVTKTGPNAINVKVTQFGDVPPSLLGNLANFTVNVPKSALPAGLTVQSVSVTQQGVLITIVGHNTTLSQ
jgi:hypothetical protein